MGDIITLARPALRLVPPAPAKPRAPSFTYCEASRQVYWGTLPLSDATVAALLHDFQRDALKTGDWDAYDNLRAAADGVNEPPLPTPPMNGAARP